MEGKIRELVFKLNKNSERLAAGGLPAKWHTLSQLEEDIGKERAKLGELRAELCELGPQASEDSSKMPVGNDDEMGGDDDSEMGGGDEEMRGNGEEDLDILDVGNWSLGEYSSGEVKYM